MQTDIIDARKRPNETSETLKYWLSPGVPSYYGYIVDADFERWEDWLVSTGSVDELPPFSDLYTNEFNDNATTPGQPANALAPAPGR